MISAPFLFYLKVGTKLFSMFSTSMGHQNDVFFCYFVNSNSYSQENVYSALLLVAKARAGLGTGVFESHNRKRKRRRGWTTGGHSKVLIRKNSLLSGIV